MSLCHLIQISPFSFLSSGLHWMPLYSPKKIVRHSQNMQWRNCWMATFTTEVTLWLSMFTASWQTSRSVCTLKYKLYPDKFSLLLLCCVYKMFLMCTKFLSVLYTLLFIAVKHWQSFSGNSFNRLHRSVVRTILNL